MEKIKCHWCGKEFEPKAQHQKYCHPYCRTEEFNTEIKAKRHFFRLMKEKQVDLDIARIRNVTAAKLLSFQKEYLRCPCAPDDKDRYCISQKCIEDIEKEGTCICGLFKKKEPKNG